MRIRGVVSVLALALLMGHSFPANAAAQAGSKSGDEAAIRAVLEAQVAAWNRGDIPAFMASYED